MSVKYTLEGFQFSSEEEYKLAKEDYDAIEFFKGKADMTDFAAVHKLYNRLIDRNTFQTSLGNVFLKELQDILLENNYRTIENLKKIEVVTFTKPAESVEEIQVEYYKTLSEKRRIKNRNSRIINVILAITIIIMFAVAIKADKTVFTNFEQDLIDKYAGWEEELEEKKDDLSEREEQLRIREEQLNSNGD